MGKKIAVGCVGLLVIGGAVAAWVVVKQGKKGTEVTMHEVTKADVHARVSSTGTLEAKLKVEISANVPGQIVNLAVTEGESVDKDQFLLQIDQAQLQAQAAGSEAALRALLADRQANKAGVEQAESDFERAKKNFAREIIPEADYVRARIALDRARAALEAVKRRIDQARAVLEASRDSLSKTTIRSPISGVVTALPVEEGEIAVIGTMNNAGTRLMTISDMSTIQADMEVDETDIPRVRIGQRATLRIDALPGEELEGRVTEIGSSPIPRSGGNQAVEFSVKIVLDDPPETVRPGFSVSADIDTGQRLDVVAIPVQAIVIQDLAERFAEEEGELEATSVAMNEPQRAGERDVEGVFKVVDSKAKFVEVETGLQGELQIEVTSGLGVGDMIITGPFRVLRTLEEDEAVTPRETDAN